MFNRDNAIGIMLLGACTVVAVILMYAIVTGEQLRVDFPPYISWPLGIAFVGLILYGLFSNFRDRRSSGRGHSWPNPQTGDKTLGDRFRDWRKKDSDSFGR